MHYHAILDEINSTRIAKLFCGECLVNEILHLEYVQFLHKYNYFCHLKLEIALAIPASNE